MQKSYYPKNKIGIRKEVYKTIESSSNSFLRVFKPKPVYRRPPSLRKNLREGGRLYTGY